MEKCRGVLHTEDNEIRTTLAKNKYRKQKQKELERNMWLPNYMKTADEDSLKGAEETYICIFKG